MLFANIGLSQSNVMLRILAMYQYSVDKDKHFTLQLFRPCYSFSRSKLFTKYVVRSYLQIQSNFLTCEPHGRSLVP